jgi:Tfp pilus assembly protein PilO
VIVLVSVFFLIPKAQEIFTHQEELKSTQQDLVDLTSKRTLLETLNQNDLLKNTMLAQSTLPSDKDIALILVSLENLSSSTGLSLDSVSFSPGAISASQTATKTSPSKGQPPALLVGQVITRKGAQAILISVKTSGSQTAVGDFIQKLASGRRLFDIQSVNINFGAQDETLTAEFSIFAYFLPNPTQIGLPNTPLAPFSPNDMQLLSRLSSFTDLAAVSVSSVSGSVSEPVGKLNLFTP